MNKSVQLDYPESPLFTDYLMDQMSLGEVSCHPLVLKKI